MINTSSKNDPFFSGSGYKLFLLPLVLMEGDSPYMLQEIIFLKLLLYFSLTKKTIIIIIFNNSKILTKDKNTDSFNPRC